MSVTLDIELATLCPHDAAALMEKVANACAKCEGVSLPLDVHILLTDDEEIREINREYRQIDRATDVLSFPAIAYAPGKTAGQSEKRISREMDVGSGCCFLGDIIISIPRAKEQAAEYGHSLTRELGYLTAHAMFHLMGYDHMEEDEKRSMRAMEEKALASVGINRVTDQELLEKARAMMQFSYAPYSKFTVGTALLASDGTVYTGCNIENSSYGLTICGERTALFKAVSEGKHDFVAIAIAGNNAMPWPCGACRQTLYEFAPDLRVLVTWNDQVEEATLSQLLPNGFGPKGQAINFLG